MSCDLCIYCGNFAYKTDGRGNPVCLNFAYTGNCNFKTLDVVLQAELERVEAKRIKRVEAKRIKRVEAKRICGINRNTACPCGSGKKYKHCCLSK